jgi:hypothetical protein
MPNMNDPAEMTFYYTGPLVMPCTIDDINFIGIFTSTSTLPTTASNFNVAGITGSGAMYVYLNNAWQFVGQYLYDAYRYFVYYQLSMYAGASSTKWTSIFNDIASNSDLMTEFANSTTAMTNLANSSTAMNAVINSSIAINTIKTSTIALNAIKSSTIAMNIVNSNTTVKNTLFPPITTVTGSSVTNTL